MMMMIHRENTPFLCLLKSIDSNCDKDIERTYESMLSFSLFIVHIVTKREKLAKIISRSKINISIAR